MSYFRIVVQRFNRAMLQETIPFWVKIIREEKGEGVRRQKAERKEEEGGERKRKGGREGRRRDEGRDEGGSSGSAASWPTYMPRRVSRAQLLVSKRPPSQVLRE